MRLFLIFVLLIMFSACTHRHDNGIFIWDENVENPFYGETLTIAVTNRDPIWRFISLFEQNNPGVEIEMIVLGYDFDIIRERMGVQMMAGEAPLLMNSNFVDMRNRGLFADWMPLIEAHPRFNDDEWLMDAFYALAEDGKLFELPESIMYQTISGNNNVPGLVERLAQMDSISHQQIIDIFFDFGGFDSGLSVGMLNFPFFSEEFVNFETGFVNFASHEFISLLEQAQELTRPTPDSILEAMSQTWHVDHLMANYYMFYNAFWCFITGSDIFYGDPAFASRLPYVNDVGELVVRPSFAHGWALSAAATKTQRALALEFIRFTQDATYTRIRNVYDDLMIFSWGTIPINRARFEYGLRRDIRSMLWNFNRPDLRLKMSHDDAVDYIHYQVRRELDRPMIVQQNVPIGIRLFFSELWDDLNLGLISPHEAATALQNRVALEILEGN